MGEARPLEEVLLDRSEAWSWLGGGHGEQGAWHFPDSRLYLGGACGFPEAHSV